MHTLKSRRARAARRRSDPDFSIPLTSVERALRSARSGFLYSTHQGSLQGPWIPFPLAHRRRRSPMRLAKRLRWELEACGLRFGRPCVARSDRRRGRHSNTRLSRRHTIAAISLALRACATIRRGECSPK